MVLSLFQICFSPRLPVTTRIRCLGSGILIDLLTFTFNCYKQRETLTYEILNWEDDIHGNKSLNRYIQVKHKLQYEKSHLFQFTPLGTVDGCTTWDLGPGM